ncbi:hypothetical protein ACHMW7_22445 [Aminobacter sp. UC22_36]|uniref:hypothetical protein n=1 Tax=Aminobacter sp. UC22_36 TaxID=3374549 RepID=UPI00375655E9
METQPRAEDEVLSQHDAQSEQLVAPETSETDSGGETATDETATGEEVVLATSPEVEAASGIELADEAENVELSAEELASDTPTELDAVAEESPEMAGFEAQAAAIEETPANEPAVELSSEELSVDATEASAETVMQIDAPPIIASDVSEAEFTQLVDDALEAVGGILLFKMRLDEDGDDKHVAAASIGDGGRRQFLLLSLPVTGGKLKVESASRSNSPLAKLAEAYVGVVEAFRAAA